jgi:hypothetical protein
LAGYFGCYCESYLRSRVLEFLTTPDVYEPALTPSFEKPFAPEENETQNLRATMIRNKLVWAANLQMSSSKAQKASDRDGLTAGKQSSSRELYHSAKSAVIGTRPFLGVLVRYYMNDPFSP